VFVVVDEVHRVIEREEWPSRRKRRPDARDPNKLNLFFSGVLKLPEIIRYFVRNMLNVSALDTRARHGWT
jgi:hypothetical protein